MQPNDHNNFLQRMQSFFTAHSAHQDPPRHYPYPFRVPGRPEWPFRVSAFDILVLVDSLGPPVPEEWTPANGGPAVSLLSMLSKDPRCVEAVSTKRPTDHDCAICIEPFDSDAPTTECGHAFHTNCLSEYIAHQCKMEELPCPVCRKHLFERAKL